MPETRPTLEEIYGSAFLTHTRPPTSLPPSARHIEPILLPSSLMGTASVPVPSLAAAPAAKENNDAQGARKALVSSTNTATTATAGTAPRRGLATLDTNVLAAELGRARLGAYPCHTSTCRLADTWADTGTFAHADAKEDPAPKPVRPVFASSATAALGGVAHPGTAHTLCPHFVHIRFLMPFSMVTAPAATEDRRPLVARLSAGAAATGTAGSTAPLPSRASAGAKPTTTKAPARYGTDSEKL
jgi:hypothetical protein